MEQRLRHSCAALVHELNRVAAQPSVHREGHPPGRRLAHPAVIVAGRHVERTDLKQQLIRTLDERERDRVAVRGSVMHGVHPASRALSGERLREHRHTAQADRAGQYEAADRQSEESQHGNDQGYVTEYPSPIHRTFRLKRNEGGSTMNTKR